MGRERQTFFWPCPLAKMLKNVDFFLALKLSNVVLNLLINVKIPAIVSIKTFMSRINFMQAKFSMKKSFITSVPFSYHF